MSLLERSNTLLRALQDGEQVDPKVVEQLANDARIEGPALSMEEGEALSESLNILVAALTAVQEDRAEQLGQFSKGKRALRGYGHARPNKRRQRLRKRV